MAQSLVCWNCGESVGDVPLPISRHANCQSCFEMLHCCRMCRHFTPEQRPYCDHERADPPAVKESANFCDYFKPMNRFQKKSAARAGKARADLEALFGEGDGAVDGAAGPNEAPDKLNDLFDD